MLGNVSPPEDSHQRRQNRPPHHAHMHADTQKLLHPYLAIVLRNTEDSICYKNMFIEGNRVGSVVIT